MISIIIPTFNSAHTLKMAIESILNQTFRDFEILILDGLSTDTTLVVARKFKDNRIKIYSEKDKGIFDAMNKGIHLAQGEWIYFLGCDDRLYNNKILELITIEILKTNCDVIYGDIISTKYNGRYAGEFDSLKLLSQNISHQSIFLKKNIFKKTGLFNTKYISWADWDHNMKWFLSPEISKHYSNLVIAEFADSGFSSLNPDSIFSNEKVLNFLLYSKNQINIRLRIKILLRELKRTLLIPDFRLFIRLISYTSRIIRGI